MLRIKLLSILILFISGCSPRVIGIYNDGVGRNAKSYMILLPEKEIKPSDNSANLDSLLQEIISASLNNKGLHSSKLPDLYISYMINVHTTSDTQPENFNYYNRYNYYNSPYYGYTSQTYKQGVFIIDIRNNDNLLVWQGSREFKLRSRQGIPDVLPEICNEVIVEFDPPQ